MKDLFGSLRRIGALFVLGFVLLICLALGVVYFQQTVKQKELRDQVARLALTINQPLAGAEQLKSDYEEVLNSIPTPDSKAIIEMIVDVARSSGIDVSAESAKFLIPPQSVANDTKVGDIIFQKITFRDIKAQGGYDKVMNFVANLEAGSILKTAVVTAANISVSKVKVKDSEELEYLALITVDVYTRR